VGSGAPTFQATEESCGKLKIDLSLLEPMQLAPAKRRIGGRG
jgi:hypothetical protein